MDIFVGESFVIGHFELWLYPFELWLFGVGPFEPWLFGPFQL